MSPYLPRNGASGSPFSEGGALYALGLIHANHGQDIRAFLLESLRATSNEVWPDVPSLPCPHPMLTNFKHHTCPHLTNPLVLSCSAKLHAVVPDCTLHDVCSVKMGMAVTKGRRMDCR